MSRQAETTRLLSSIFLWFVLLAKFGAGAKLSPSIRFCPDGSQPEYSRSGSLSCYVSAMCPDNYTCKDGICCFTRGPRGCPHRHQFECLNGECIDRSNRCNKVYECSDGSDELDCVNYAAFSQQQPTPPLARIFPSTTFRPQAATSAERICRRNEFRCESLEQCIDAGSRCDGVRDCNDGSDEQICEGTRADDRDRLAKELRHAAVTMSMALEHRSTEDLDYRCPRDHYQCRSGHCLPNNRLCDEYHDCPNGDDEDNCHLKPVPPLTILPAAHPTLSSHYDNNGNDINVESQCRGNEFECDDGGCILLSHRCDGFSQCRDGSDENDCPFYAGSTARTTTRGIMTRI